MIEIISNIFMYINLISFKRFYLPIKSEDPFDITSLYVAGNGKCKSSFGGNVCEGKKVLD